MAGRIDGANCIFTFFPTPRQVNVNLDATVLVRTFDLLEQLEKPREVFYIGTKPEEVNLNGQKRKNG